MVSPLFGERVRTALPSKIFLAALLILFFIGPTPATPASAQPPMAPFFLMGDGRIHIKNVHSKKEARVALLRPDGSIDEAAQEQIDAVFGFLPEEKGEHISLRLLFMLNYFSNQVAPGRTIFLTSGYRSPEYNDGLRRAGGNVAKTSTHMDGLALDFYIEGVKGRDLWEIIRQNNCAGVGHYGGREIHLDAARPRFWEATTSKVTTNESDYNRRMYLATDFDRYRPAQDLRLSLTSISNFGFGINTRAFLLARSEGQETVRELEIPDQTVTNCLPVQDRRAARSIRLTLPQDLQGGRYRIRIDFCQKPFDQMPDTATSNEFEILAHP
jgi:uncharacterized protein YcbK (DUF882 family)